MESKKPTRQYKKHTLFRRQDAKKNNFRASDLQGKFKMIIRQRTPAEAWLLYRELSHEEQNQFIRTHYKGFTVRWAWRAIESFSFSPPRINTVGYVLEAWPKIRNTTFHVELSRTSTKLGKEAVLAKIKQVLPTVKAL